MRLSDAKAFQANFNDLSDETHFMMKASYLRTHNFQFVSSSNLPGPCLLRLDEEEARERNPDLSSPVLSNDPGRPLTYLTLGGAEQPAHELSMVCSRRAL